MNPELRAFIILIGQVFPGTTILWAGNWVPVPRD